ncbi:MAG: hypothetical protein Q9164_001741 [Protoblastenia rupestris]
MAAQLVQMVTVVDKSGKAVNSSKHIVNVWKEAKAAYKERKAEVVAGRQSKLDDRRTHRTGKALEDGRSRTSSPMHRSHHGSRHHSYQEEPRRSPRSPRSGPPSPSTIYPSSHSRFSQDLHHSSAPPPPGIQRSFSAQDDNLPLARPPPMSPRSYTSPPSSNVDMDLAYGDLPGPLTTINTRQADEEELKGLVGKVKKILDEADCLQYSASATIDMLQKNPDAMAAVALTLAEISNIASKMAPGVLMSIKGSAPAVFALLASPQFLIAGGVAVGITIVAFGGYKIIKKIRAKQALEDPGMDEMLEVDDDVSRIDNWRRGIAEEQAHSVGTSVEGEYITPTAAALCRLNLEESESSSRGRSKGSKKEKSSRSGSVKTSQASSKANSTEKSSKRTSKDGSSTADSKAKKDPKVKKPSPLRLMFH